VKKDKKRKTKGGILKRALKYQNEHDMFLNEQDARMYANNSR
jgi:hypothetical protein